MPSLIETVIEEKALDALVTGLHIRTLFWRNVQNSQSKTYSQLVDLVQREIRSEETIENREKAERKRGRRSPEPRFSRFQKKYFPGPRNNHCRRFNQTEMVPALSLKHLMDLDHKELDEEMILDEGLDPRIIGSDPLTSLAEELEAFSVNP
ncbi:hypothetical protein Adt_11468 [Abeliophyllum distichum]|uniref:Uncharacterized protein n=1 Tax=Abeliophyllum distichum TaxID=126358 RepID=A0ABD1UN02_9LAMI